MNIFDEALVELHNGYTEHAEQLCTKGLQENQYAPQGYHTLGMVFQAKEQHKQAVHAFRTSLLLGHDSNHRLAEVAHKAFPLLKESVETCSLILLKLRGRITNHMR